MRLSGYHPPRERTAVRPIAEVTVPSVAETFRQRLIDLAASAAPERIIRGGQDAIPAQESARGSRYTHVADHYEFVWPVQGRTRIALPGRIVELNAGEVLLIERGVAHSEIVAEPLAAYEVFWLHVRANAALLTETRFTPPASWTPTGPVELSGRVDLQNLASAIASELTARGWGWEGAVKGLLHYLVAIVVRRLDRADEGVLRLAESPVVQADPRTCSIVRHVLEYCEEHYRQGVGLKEVAAALGYSPSYLSRLVSRHLGRSLSEHLHNRRVQAAKHMLENLELAVNEVAQQLGYSDPAHFSRAFTRATGLSPKAYRRRLGGL